MRLERPRGLGRAAVPIIISGVLAASLAVSIAGPATAELVEDVFPGAPYRGMQLSYSINGATLGAPLDELVAEDAPGPAVRTYQGTYGDEVLTIAGEATLRRPDGDPASQAWVNAYVQSRTGGTWEVLDAQEQVVDYDASGAAAVPFIASAPTPTDPDSVVILVVEAFPTDPALADAWIEVSATLTHDGGAGVVDAPTAEPFPTGEPSGDGELRLTSVDLPGQIAAGQLLDVIAGGPGFIAVGWGVLDPDVGPEATLLTSSDGLGWDLAPLPLGAAIKLVDVTEWSGGYAALGWGSSLGEVTAWTSEDGVDWVPAPLPVARNVVEADPIAIAGYGDGLLAVGCARLSVDGGCGGNPVAWTSGDGFTWERSRLGLSEGWSPEGVASIGSRLVLVGGTDWGMGAPAAATSSDGVVWTEATLDGTGVLANGHALDDATLLAAGWGTDADGVDRGRVSWSADSGTTWEDLAYAPAESEFRAISPTADIIVGCEGSQGCWEGTPAAWTLDESMEPILVPADRATDRSDGVLGAFAPFAGERGGVAVGWTSTPGEYAFAPGAWLIAAGAGPEVIQGPDPGSTPRPERPSPTDNDVPPAFSELEQYLVDALPPDVARTCTSRWDRLPEGTVAAIDCWPDDPSVQATAYYLMSADDAKTVWEERADEYLRPKRRYDDSDDVCRRDLTGVPGSYATGGDVVVLTACYYDEEGRPNFRIVNDRWATCHRDPLQRGGRVVNDPAVYYAILGPDTVRLPELEEALYGIPLTWDYPDGDCP